MACNTNPESTPVFKFSIDRPMNVGTMAISDPLLDTLAAATERASSEFLKNSYSSVDISFVIDKSDLALNDEISIDNVVYLVKGISISVNNIRALSTITARRYD